MTQRNNSPPPPGERPRSNFFDSFPLEDDTSYGAPPQDPPPPHSTFENADDDDDDDIAPPAYGDLHDQINLSQAGFEAGAAVTRDGRVSININQKDSMLADLLMATTRNTAAQHQPSTSTSTSTATTGTQTTSSSSLLPITTEGGGGPLPPPYIPPNLSSNLNLGLPGQHENQTPPPKLNIVIQIVGSRGDVQPFIALGKILRDTYGHRIRIATHPTFQSFVEENGLEFFSIGGDPAELMAFMVKNPGLMPGIDALKKGEIKKRRLGIEEIVLGCWRSCIEAGDGKGVAPPGHRPGEELLPSLGDDRRGMSFGTGGGRPFVADAIIANPPSFAHIHVAEKLGIPLHIMFTMPWSPTRAFAHPLANIESSNTDPVMTNYISYVMVEMMTWQGLGDVINRFRTKVLDLEPLSLLWAPGLLSRLRVPTTYCWSPALIPKPADWGDEVTVSGFFFLDLADRFVPDAELEAFLRSGPPPVYIGFGSIVVDDPNALTRKILDAISLSGVRALVSKGWGGLGADAVGLPEGVFMLGNVPHDWLFQRVSAVVHHGGAGTSAAGIKAGKPTVVVPFFGDQPFWGAMIAKAGAGPPPIPFTKLTAENLASAIRECMRPETQLRAQELGNRIKEERGADVGGRSFHEFLNIDSLRCSLAPSRTAVWRVRRTKTRLSALAAAVLVHEGLLKYSDLKLYRSVEHNTEEQPWDPISAVTAGLVGDLSSMAMAVGDFPREMFKGANWKRTVAEIQARNRSASDVAGSSTRKGTTATDDGTSTIRSGGSELQPFSSTSQASLVSSSGGNSQLGPPTPGGSSTPGPKTPTRSNSGGSGSGSGSGNSNSTTTATTRKEKLKECGEEAWEATNKLTLETAVGAGKGVSRIVGSGFKMPLNFCLGLARGFRNAPKLYSDDTVRPAEKVTDLASGLRVAGKEFGWGMYDGISGLVTQPIRGAKKEGAAGIIKGFGKGVGGLILKPAAAAWALPAYSMQGIHAEVKKMSSRSSTNYIITARVWQGKEDLEGSSAEERGDIVLRWKARESGGELKGFYQVKLKEREREREVLGSMMNLGGNQNQNQNPSVVSVVSGGGAVSGSAEDVSSVVSGPTASVGVSDYSSSSPQAAGSPQVQPAGPPRTGWFHTRNMSFDQRKRLHEQKDAWKAAAAAEKSRGHQPGDAQSQNQHQPQQSQSLVLEDDEFEAAIRASVAQTSQGDKDEDAKVEAAIRNSIMEMGIIARRQQDQEEKGKGKGNDGVPDLDGAGCSTGRSKDKHKDKNTGKGLGKSAEVGTDYFTDITDEEYQALIEEAVKQSLVAQQKQAKHGLRDSDDESYDEDLMKALEASRVDSFAAPPLPNRAVTSPAAFAGGASRGMITAEPEEDENEQIRRAIEESERQHKEQMEMKNRQRTEEDIVLEYVKKQSLAEEEFRIKRKAVGSGTGSSRGGVVSGSGKGKSKLVPEEEVDEDLRRALELSLKEKHRTSWAGRGDDDDEAGPSGTTGAGDGSDKGKWKTVYEMP